MELLAKYWEIELIDDNIGRLIKTLDENGQRKTRWLIRSYQNTSLNNHLTFMSIHKMLTPVMKG